jgi:hypothetical protein
MRSPFSLDSVGQKKRGNLLSLIYPRTFLISLFWLAEPTKTTELRAEQTEDIGRSCEASYPGALILRERVCLARGKALLSRTGKSVIQRQDVNVIQRSFGGSNVRNRLSFQITRQITNSDSVPSREMSDSKAV